MEKTLFFPIWGRAHFAGLFPAFQDPGAALVMERTAFDFKDLKEAVGTFGSIYSGYRSYRVDEKIRNFLARHPDGVILDIGAGLDHPASRMSDLNYTSWSLDLEGTINVRKRYFPDTDMHKSFVASIGSPNWLDPLPRDKPVLVTMIGVSMYLSSDLIERALIDIANYFDRGEMIIDAMSPTGLFLTNLELKLSRMTMAPLTWGTWSGKQFSRYCPKFKLKERSFLLKRLTLTVPVDFYTRIQMWFARCIRFSQIFHLTFSRSELNS